MRNVRVTVLARAIPLKSKTAKDIEHDYNLFLGTKSIAISLKAQVFSIALIADNNASLSDWSFDVIHVI